MRFVLILAALLPGLFIPLMVGAGDESACDGCSACGNHESRRQNGWTIVETDNFSVWSRLNRTDTRRLACACEELRAALILHWHDEERGSSWRPKCVLVVHADLNEYRRAVDCGANPAVGCTTITTDGGRVVFRRIDLRADAGDWRSNALPHELTHVVLADHLPQQSLPVWLNEGLAMTAESSELQQRRLKVLETARAADRLPPLGRILNADGAAVRRMDTDVFYAVSYSLVDFLRREGESGELLRFVVRSLEDGYSAALRETYEIRGGVEELERRWRDATLGVRRSSGLAAQ